MGAPAVNLFPAAASVVSIAEQPVTIAFGPLLGGLIVNPASSLDQNVSTPEVLYIDDTGAPAASHVTATTFALEPGQAYKITPGQTTPISVNAATAGHAFSAFIILSPPQFPPTPQIGTFPPSGPTTLTGLGKLYAYLYEEYDDDDALQAMTAAINSLQDGYIGWFANTPLAVYTDPSIAGPLLDFIADGIYGMKRPALSSGRPLAIGPLNTWRPNQLLPINTYKIIGPANVAVTTDDVFKRIMTWNFYKGDGNIFNAKWIKRRVMRFLLGVNGTAPNIDQTYDVSVTFGDSVVAIAVTVGTRTTVGGALPNRFAPNQLVPLNTIKTKFVPASTQYPLEPVLQQAIESGALIFPFQYDVAIAI